jgi:hypothetical protein
LFLLFYGNQLKQQANDHHTTQTANEVSHFMSWIKMQMYTVMINVTAKLLASI